MGGDFDQRAENGRALVEFIRELSREVDRLTIRVHAMQVVLERHGIPTAEVDRENSTAASSWKGQLFAQWFDAPDPPAGVQ